MDRFIHENKRTHRCGSLRDSNINETVTLMGWVQNRRDHGGCVFIDLRDREGITQVVFDPSIDEEAHRKAGDLRSEWCLAVEGTVRSRGQQVNPKLATGAIEVAATRLEVFSASPTPPFQVEERSDTAEEIRLQYRYLDLRRPPLQRNLQIRHRFNQIVRRTLDAQGFLELETPFLIKSTPEGARDYVVPSRVNPGSFFALPQSPQIFKQLFMVSGFDRYFQIVRCFRDEDLRAERQPEFTQIDLEMSFCSQEDVQNITEQILYNVWKELLDIELPRPFPRITYAEAIERFGLDAPDLRFGLELKDLSQVVKGCGFKVFNEVVEKGGLVKAINLEGMADLSRKDLDDLTEFVKIYGAKGLAWVKVKDDGEWQSPIAKFLGDEVQDRIGSALSLKPGDVAVFVADTPAVTNAALGNLRKHVAKKRGLISEGEFRFCWVTDFPSFEYNEDTKRWDALHHPFTSPRPEDVERMESDPGSVKALAYDVVLNGLELGGGSIRIHDSQVQQRMFSVLGLTPEEAEEKFGFLLKALSYGAPPHGGLALGADRTVMMICGASSLRDVIAFPKTQKQTDLMLDAPAPLVDEQMAELSIRTVLPKKEE